MTSDILLHAIPSKFVLSIAPVHLIHGSEKSLKIVT